MKASLKYIEVRGKMIACGEYDMANVWVRPYEGVTLKDTDGEELRFKILMIPKSLDDHIVINEECTFFILRNESSGQLVGALYAVEASGQKFFYEEDAARVVRHLGMGVSIRGNLLLNPLSGTALLVLGAWVAFMLGYLPFSELLGLGLVTGAGLSVAWCCYVLKPFLGWKSFIGLKTLTDRMKETGFIGLSKASGKY